MRTSVALSTDSKSLSSAISVLTSCRIAISLPSWVVGLNCSLYSEESVGESKAARAFCITPAAGGMALALASAFLRSIIAAASILACSLSISSSTARHILASLCFSLRSSANSTCLLLGRSYNFQNQ